MKTIYHKCGRCKVFLQYGSANALLKLTLDKIPFCIHHTRGYDLLIKYYWLKNIKVIVFICLTCVSFNMDSEVFASWKSFWTKCTLIRFFPCMYSHVLLKLRWTNAPTTAIRTNVRFFTTMRSWMNCQSGWIWKTFTTDVAHVRPFTYTIKI